MLCYAMAKTYSHILSQMYRPLHGLLADGVLLLNFQLNVNSFIIHVSDDPHPS